MGRELARGNVALRKRNANLKRAYEATQSTLCDVLKDLRQFKNIDSGRIQDERTLIASELATAQEAERAAIGDRARVA